MPEATFTDQGSAAAVYVLCPHFIGAGTEDPKGK